VPETPSLNRLLLPVLGIKKIMEVAEEVMEVQKEAVH